MQTVFKKNEDIFLLKDAVSPFRGLIYAIYHWPGRERQCRPHTRSELALAQPLLLQWCNGLQLKKSSRVRRVPAGEPSWLAGTEQGGHLQCSALRCRILPRAPPHLPRHPAQGSIALVPAEAERGQPPAPLPHPRAPLMLSPTADPLHQLLAGIWHSWRGTRFNFEQGQD